MELRACYFCGSPGSGLDTYPVVPDRVAPDARDDPEHVVLCPDCHAKLERVLDGVLESLDAASVDPDGSVPSATGDTSTEITFEEADAGSSGHADAGPTDGSDESDDPGDAGGVSGRTDGDPADAGIDVVPGPSTDDGSEGTADDATGAAETDGVGTVGADGADGPDVVDTDGADGDDGTDTDGAEAVDTDGADGAGDGADTDASGGGSGSLRGLGDSGTNEYRQALRLLQNREFPMPRSELVDVMSSAYDLSRDECDRLVDFAVEREWIVDDGGVLRED